MQKTSEASVSDGGTEHYWTNLWKIWNLEKINLFKIYDSQYLHVAIHTSDPK